VIQGFRIIQDLWAWKISQDFSPSWTSGTWSETVKPLLGCVSAVTLPFACFGGKGGQSKFFDNLERHNNVSENTHPCEEREDGAPKDKAPGKSCAS
jgi:hypothetical protein